MKIPFLNRFITKKKSAFEMEEITDKTLREFLRNPWEDEEQIGDVLAGDSRKIGMVMEQMKRMLPVFCRITGCIDKETDDVKIAGEEGVILPYVAALREIAVRQKPEDNVGDGF